VNSRNKGKRGEREFAALLTENGYHARRGQQFCGGTDSADVMSPALPWLHVEVKRVQNLNLTDACAQAERDAQKSGQQKAESGNPNGCKAPAKPWIVAHRRNHAPWLITMTAETFFELIREFQPRMNTDGHGCTAGAARRVAPDESGDESPHSKENGAHGVTRPT